jgi:hypothetical protein
MSTEIEVAMAQGGRFDHDETEAILTAAEQARDNGEVAYLTLDGVRIATIGPLPAAEHPAAPEPEPGPATRIAARVPLINGTRHLAWAIQVTETNHQRVIGWLQGHAESADWSDDPGRLNFGGRRGSYSIPAGCWVVLFTPEDCPHRAGVEGWDPDDFGKYWMDKADADHEDRAELAAQVSLYRASHRY